MHIERRSYSRKPWRLISSDGRQVTQPRIQDHYGVVALVHEPVCANSRRECEAMAFDMLENLIHQHNAKQEQAV